MQFRAILACRECGAKQTDDFSFEGCYEPDVSVAQGMYDNKVEMYCDQCGNNDWRVYEIYELENG